MFVSCLTSQQHASVSQGQIYSDNGIYTETEVADQTFYLTQSQDTDTGPTSPSADPVTPDAWQGSHWSANIEITGMTRPEKILVQAGIEPQACHSRGGQANKSNYKSRVPDQNGISQACYIVEIYHSGPEPSKYKQSVSYTGTHINTV